LTKDFIAHRINCILFLKKEADIFAKGNRYFMKHGKLVIFIFFLLAPVQLFSFEKGWTLGLKAFFSGSYTNPIIGQKDKDYLGAHFMRGMVGFVMSGEAELTYIFDAEQYFNQPSNDVFSGLGLAFNLGIGQGFSGQISGTQGQRFAIGDKKYAKDIEVYCRVYLTPVVTFGTSVKALLLKNRLAVGLGIGGRMLADPQPTYELYSNLTNEEVKYMYNSGKGPDFSAETGTLFIPSDMMKKMNPLGFALKTSIEYNQPVISRMDLTVGAYMSYTIYKPGYVSLPKKIAKAAIENGKQNGISVDFERDKIKSFYMNNFDFGVSLGLLFAV